MTKALFNLSHAKRNTVDGAVESIANKIQQRGDLPYISVTHQLEHLKALSQFELGRFLLQTGGLNGYWTRYIVNHPKQGRLTGLNSENLPFTELEIFLLDQAPVILATQQRSEIFRREIQSRLQDEVTLASIPCGLSNMLLELDFSQIPHFSIYGIDIDQESLIHSQKIAVKLGIAACCQFIQRDAWDLDFEDEFDIVTSNGLSIYEPDNQKIVELYRQFFLSLKPNGCLVTSFLTPKSEWDLNAVNSEHALKQKILFSDILECKWQIFRSEQLVRDQLFEAGFADIEVFYDNAHMFPTIVARKIKERQF